MAGREGDGWEVASRELQTALFFEEDIEVISWVILMGVWVFAGLCLEKVCAKFQVDWMSARQKVRKFFPRRTNPKADTESVYIQLRKGLENSFSIS